MAIRTENPRSIAVPQERADREGSQRNRRTPGKNRNVETKAGEDFKRSVVSNVKKGSSNTRSKECPGFDNVKPMGHICLSRFPARWNGGLSSGGYQ